MNDSGLRAKMYRNIIRSISAKYFQYVFQFILLAVYARYFTPEQFGLVAILTIITSFFMLFGQAGIGPALITKRQLTERQVGGVFLFSIVLGFIISFCFYVSLFGMNVIYHRSDYQYIGAFSAFAIMFNIFNSVPQSLLLKKSMFFPLSAILVFSEFISLVTVLNLYDDVGNRVYLLTLRVLITSLLNFSLTIIYVRYFTVERLVLSTEMSGLNIIKKFSINVLGFNFLNYFTRNLDKLIIGKVFNSSSLAIYEKSYSLLRYPLELVTFAMSPAIQPVLTSNKYTIEKVRELHLDIARISIAFGIIVSFLMYANAGLIVHIVLGNQWASVVPILKALLLSLPMQFVSSLNGGFWQARDKTDKQFLIAKVNAMIFIPCVIFFSVYCDSLIELSFTISALLIITCSIALLSIFNILYNQSIRDIFLLVLYNYSKLVVMITLLSFVDINNTILVLCTSVTLSLFFYYSFFILLFKKVKERIA